jgi:ABC-type antimicrobial peptide transport system permease subunit
LLCDELDEKQSNTLNNTNSNKTNIITHDYDDEEELLEMFEMQEECRLEMMKFYVQAQNPELFEEVYYGVNYSGEQSNNSNSKQYQQQQVSSQQNQRDQHQNKVNGLTNMMKDNLNLKECSNP